MDEQSAAAAGSILLLCRIGADVFLEFGSLFSSSILCKLCIYHLLIFLMYRLLCIFQMYSIILLVPSVFELELLATSTRSGSSPRLVGWGSSWNGKTVLLPVAVAVDDDRDHALPCG